MHIVQLLPELNEGGVERGTVEISRELVKRGHQSTVISAGGKLVERIVADGGNHVIRGIASKNPLTVPKRVWAIERVLRELNPDILHARSRVPAWLCLWAKKKLNIPFVTTVHGFNSVNWYSEIMVKGDRVIYGSSAIKDYVLEHYSLDEFRLRYVPRGIDMDYFSPDSVDHGFISAFKKQHRLEGKCVVSMVGRITGIKGHKTFIPAIAKVSRNNPEVIGLIVGGVHKGKKDYYKLLTNLSQELGVVEKVRFVGSQPNMREILLLSDMVVSSSSKPETFGRTVGEALAMNTPVIASAHGGVLDVVCDNENGLLFQPGDASDLADKIEEVMTRTFSNMREHIRHNFSLDQMTEMKLKVYQELVDERIGKVGCENSGVTV